MCGLKEKGLGSGGIGRRMAMKYRQLNAEERSALAALRSLGLNKAEIARQLGGTGALWGGN